MTYEKRLLATMTHGSMDLNRDPVVFGPGGARIGATVIPHTLDDVLDARLAASKKAKKTKRSLPNYVTLSPEQVRDKIVYLGKCIREAGDDFSQVLLAAFERAYHRPPSAKWTGELTYEDRVHVWCIACKLGVAAPYAPEDVSTRGKRHRAQSGRLLLPLHEAVAELNARLPDVPQLRGDQAKRIVAEFKDVAPPYSSFDPALRKQTVQAEKRKSDRREYMRKYMRQRRDNDGLSC